ncbi:MAG: thioredoxin family protein [Methanosarcinales archaeon]|nr:thioredoxin family protein [Methanosarcinales archaeon]
MIKQYGVLIIIIFLTVLISLCGCVDQEPVTSAASNELITVNSTQDIDLLLQQSPVFIKIGAQRCPSCREQEPIITELIAQYGNQVKFVYIDSDKQSQLATQFNVYYIPDMTIIVKKDSKGYNYVTRYGTQTYNRQEAVIFGFTPKEVLEVPIKQAIKLR